MTIDIFKNHKLSNPEKYLIYLSLTDNEQKEILSYIFFSKENKFLKSLRNSIFGNHKNCFEEGIVNTDLAKKIEEKTGRNVFSIKEPKQGQVFTDISKGFKFNLNYNEQIEIIYNSEIDSVIKIIKKLPHTDELLLIMLFINLNKDIYQLFKNYRKRYESLEVIQRTTNIESKIKTTIDYLNYNGCFELADNLKDVIIKEVSKETFYKNFKNESTSIFENTFIKLYDDKLKFQPFTKKTTDKISLNTLSDEYSIFLLKCLKKYLSS